MEARVMTETTEGIPNAGPLIVSREDFEALQAAIENPPPPTERLRNLMQETTVKTGLRCLFGFHAPSEGRSMGTSIDRKRRGILKMFAYDFTCPRCGRTRRKWR
jgi:hypothetical protein